MAQGNNSENKEENENNLDFSYIEDNVSNFAINVINRKRIESRKNIRKKPVWVPSGNVSVRDGYSVIRKMYY